MNDVIYILGYPGAGKTTFIENNAQERDWILSYEFDSFQNAIISYRNTSVLRLWRSCKFAGLLIMAYVFSQCYDLKRLRSIISTARIFYYAYGAKFKNTIIVDENIIHRIFIIFFGLNLNRINSYLLRSAVVCASDCTSLIIIMRTDKNDCISRIKERSSHLSRFNKFSTKKIQTDLLNDQIYSLILEVLRQNYKGKIYEY